MKTIILSIMCLLISLSLVTSKTFLKNRMLQNVVLKVANGPFGNYLTDANGMPLYMFEADYQGKSTCYQDCAVVWIAYTQRNLNAAVGDGVDSRLVSTQTRTDGSLQVAYNKWPLYYYLVDSAAGDTSGQGVNGSGGLWYLMAPNGEPITGAPTAGGAAAAGNSTETNTTGNATGNATAQEIYNNITGGNNTTNATAPLPQGAPLLKISTGPKIFITDTNGMSLYAFASDKDGKSTCTGLCANAWPPLVISKDQNGPINLDTGLDAAMLTNFTRTDGSLQVVWNNWPLYHFIRDVNPGDILGQGVKSSGDIWWLVQPNGELLFNNSTVAAGEGAANATTPEGSATAPMNETTPSESTIPSS